MNSTVTTVPTIDAEPRNMNVVNKGATKAKFDILFNGYLIVKGFKIMETVTDQGPRIWVAAPARLTEGKNGAKGIWNDIVYCEKKEYWQSIAATCLDYFYKNSQKMTP